MRCGLYPVCEVVHGRDWSVQVEPTFERAALERYLAAQGRFRGTADDVAALSAAIGEQWSDLRRKANGGTR